MQKIRQLILTIAFVGWGLFSTAQQAGTIDPSFIPALDIGATVTASAIQSDGKIIIGGNFPKGIKRLNVDGSPDNTFQIGTGTDARVFAIALQSDGKIIIGGRFSTYNSVNCNGIARLNQNGSLDTTFITGTGIDTIGTLTYGVPEAIWAIKIQTDNKIIIGGNFNHYNGTLIKNLARLNTNGVLDTSFVTGEGPSDPVYTIALQNDGNIIIGGRFFAYNFICCSSIYGFIARIHADGSQDSTFLVNIGPLNVSYVSTISVQSDGKIIVGGDFNGCNGTLAHDLVRLNPDGTIDNTFTLNQILPIVYFEVLATAVQTDGKIIIGGRKTLTFSNDTTILISRLNSDGTRDSTFHSGTALNNSFDIYTIAIQNDGKIIIGGDFTSYDGTVRNRIARLNGSTPLSVEPFTIVEESAISLFPNPNNSVFNLQFMDSMQGGTISITNSFGRQIYYSIIDTSKTALNIDISGQPAGVYNVQVMHNERLYRNKMIIQK